MIGARPQPRRHLLLPLLLISGGAIALLAEAGLLPSGTLERLIQLWPLLLVLLGVQIVVAYLLPGRTGLLTSVAVMTALIVMGVGFAAANPIGSGPTSTFRTGTPVAGLASGALQLDTAPATLHLVGRDLGDELYRAEVRHAIATAPAVEVAGGHVHLVTPRARLGFFQVPSTASDDVQLALSSRVPWVVAVHGAGLSGQADLTGLDLSGFTLKGAGARLDLRLGAEPHGSVPVNLSGVGLDLTLKVPRETRVHALAEGLAMAVDANGALSNEVTWTGSGAGAESGRYEVRLEGVGSRVHLEMLP